MKRLPIAILACATVIVGSASVATTAVSSNADAAANICIRNVGDLNGDGRTDYAVSGRKAKKSVVFLVYGHGAPPSIESLASGRQQANAILRDAAAAPFLCSASTGTAGAAASSRRPRTAVATGQQVVGSAGNLPSYNVIDLDPLMPGFSAGFSSATSAINNHGQVAGRFFTPEGERAYLYSQGVVRDLGTLGGRSSAASGINDAGEVVGYSLTGAFDESGLVSSAFVYNDYGLQDLGTTWSAARAINDAGQIVGEMRFAPGVDILHAFLFDRGGPLNLGALAPYRNQPYSTAASVNAQGQVVGESNTVIPGLADPSVGHAATHAFIYENGELRDLGTLGASCVVPPMGGEQCLDRSVATAITDTGLVVGFSITPSRLTHAFVSGGNGLIDLGSLEGGETWAYGANDSGQVVGAALTASGRYAPFLYDSGVLYDLTTLMGPAATTPIAAYGINDFGQIIGDHHLLTPQYDTAAPGRPFSQAMTAGDAVSFEYWSTGLSPSACAGGQVELQVRTASGTRVGRWRQAATLVDCDGPGAWRTVSVPVPAAMRGTDARVDVRIVAAPPAAVVHLRRFR